MSYYKLRRDLCVCLMWLASAQQFSKPPDLVLFDCSVSCDFFSLYKTQQTSEHTTRRLFSNYAELQSYSFIS